jgi:hypothetical protein
MSLASVAGGTEANGSPLAGSAPPSACYVEALGPAVAAAMTWPDRSRR